MTTTDRAGSPCTSSAPIGAVTAEERAQSEGAVMGTHVDPREHACMAGSRAEPSRTLAEATGLEIPPAYPTLQPRAATGITRESLGVQVKEMSAFLGGGCGSLRVAVALAGVVPAADENSRHHRHSVVAGQAQEEIHVVGGMEARAVRGREAPDAFERGAAHERRAGVEDDEGRPAAGRGSRWQRPQHSTALEVPVLVPAEDDTEVGTAEALPIPM